MNKLYIFDNKDDYYTATASAVDTPATYTLTSLYAKPGKPELTTLSSPQGRQGSIHWKDHAIETDGAKHFIDDIKQKDTGPGYEPLPLDLRGLGADYFILALSLLTGGFTMTSSGGRNMNWTRRHGR
jgi:hypothetical protein